MMKQNKKVFSDMPLTSLFDRIGGTTAVRMAVAKMYDKILSDEELAIFFDDIDVDALRRSQTAFVTMAFGGPDHYDGANLRRAHTRLVEQGLSDRHFDAVAGHLEDAMRELGVAESLITEALAIVESTRKDVLNQ